MEYIKLDDITTKLFNRFPEESRQNYIDLANMELQDIAIRKGVGVDDIVTPIHHKLKRYACLYAVALLCEDNIGLSNSAGTYDGDQDVYEATFKRNRYLMQSAYKDIVPVMFTGEKQTPLNRAISSQRIIRG